MAKRRKVDDTESSELFTPPEFDVADFLKKEIKKAKGIIIVFLIAIVIGLFSAYVQVSIDTFIAYAIGIAVIFVMKPILKALNAEFSDRKTWAFAIIAFLILWLSFWTVGLNPPFNDVSPPQIRVVEVYTGASTNATWIEIYDYEASYNPALAKKIKDNKNSLDWSNITKVRALVTDNVGVGAVYINSNPASLSDGYYVASVSGSSSITITAEDVNGHSSTLTV